MNNYLFYAGVIGFTLGIFIQSLLPLSIPAWCAVVVVSSALLWLGRGRNKVPPAPSLYIISVFLLLGTLGALRMEFAMLGEINPLYESQVESKVTLEGVVVREVERREKSSHVYVDVDGELVLTFASVHVNVFYGDRVKVEGTLQKPTAFETDLGRTFLYDKYLQARGVSYVLFYADVEVVASQTANPLIYHLLTFKHAFIQKVEAVIPHPEAGLGEGLLLGVKQALGEDIEAAFRTTGITHIVVLSGYNVMLVILFVMYVLAFVLPLRARLIVGLLAIVLFALLVGLSATVVRACIMASLLLIARIFGHTFAVVRTLLFAGMVMLLFNPYLLVYDVGFQLSFIATLGLILLAPYIEQYVTFMPKVLGLREFLTSTLATQLFVAPILLYQIGEFSLVSVVVNVLVLPMVPVAMLLTFITGMLGFVLVPLSLPFALLATWSLRYILFVATAFAAVPFAAITVPPFPFVVVVFAYVLCALLLWRVYKKTNPQSTDQTFASWTIVDETEFVESLKNTSKQQNIVPTFFR